MSCSRRATGYSLPRLVSSVSGGALNSTDESSKHVALRVEHGKVGIGSSVKNAFIRASGDPRWISSGRSDRLRQVPFRKARQVAYGAVHSQDAARQFAVARALAIFDIDLERPETIAAIRHASRGDCIRDEHGLVETFGAGKQFDDGGIEMNAVGDDVASDSIISENGTEDSGIAMLEGTHGIEGVGSVARSGGYRAFSGRKVGVGMSQAH